jgi:uncharacterized protein
MGSAVAGGVVGAITWFVFGSLVASAALGSLAFVIVLVADFFQMAGPSSRGGYSGSSSGWSGGGGGWSSDSSSSSDSGGGGGSFGGGGASGSW